VTDCVLWGSLFGLERGFLEGILEHKIYRLGLSSAMRSAAGSLSLRFSSNGQEKLELWWKLILSVESVREIDSSNSAVCMNLNSQGLYVVGTISSSGEIRQVELNLIPAFIKSHWHGTDEWLDSCGTLIIGGSESSSHALIIEYLDLKSEVLFQVLDDHDQERKLDGQGLFWIKRSVNIVC